jgi:hypothetical protein
VGRMLPLRGDREGRLVCSECWKGHRDDSTWLWLFEQYRDADGKMSTAPERFELRQQGETLESRERAPGAQEWRPFPGGSVFCVGCHESPRGSYRVFDPRTGAEIEA